MRTFHVCGITISVLTVLAFSHCGPIAASTTKGGQSFGTSSSGGSTVYNLATVEPAPVASNSRNSSAIASNSQWVAAVLTGEEQAQLDTFKATGQIYIPADLGDPNSVRVTISVAQTTDQITSLKINPLRLTKGSDSNGSYLTIAKADAGIAKSVTDSAVSVEISLPSSATASVSKR